MKSKLRRLLKTKDKRGATIIMVALSLVIIVGVATFAVDIGYLMIARNQLQNIADSAALAATRKLGSIYEDRLANDLKGTYTCNPSDIEPVAQVIGAENQAGGVSIVINSSDVIIGQWNAIDHVLVQTLDDPDAVKVIARRDASANGPVSSFFARILGINSFNVSAQAVAALSSVTKIGPKKLGVPFSVPKIWLEDPATYCNQPIQFHPTKKPKGCAGWHTYTIKPSSDKNERDIIDGLFNETFTRPETIAGETQYEFIGGDLSQQTFDGMKALFDKMKDNHYGNGDLDNNPLTWTTGIPIYDATDCSNPNQSIIIAGFSTVTITDVHDAGGGPDGKIIMGKVNCDSIIPGVKGGGGGSIYSSKGSIPRLVK